jgi:hypothetical protein
MYLLRGLFMLKEEAEKEWKNKMLSLLNEKEIFIYEDEKILFQSNEEEFEIITKDLSFGYYKDSVGFFDLTRDIKFEQWLQGFKDGDKIVFLLKELNKFFIKKGFDKIERKEKGSPTIKKKIDTKAFQEEDFVEY